MLLISEESEFHNLGAAIVNDLSPIVAAGFFNCWVNNIALLDRRLYLVFVFCLMCTILAINKVAMSCSALKVIRMTLNCILSVAGNQCSSFKRAVMGQYFDFINMTRQGRIQGFLRRGCTTRE